MNVPLPHKEPGRNQYFTASFYLNVVKLEIIWAVSSDVDW